MSLARCIDRQSRNRRVYLLEACDWRWGTSSLPELPCLCPASRQGQFSRGTEDRDLPLYPSTTIGSPAPGTTSCKVRRFSLHPHRSVGSRLERRFFGVRAAEKEVVTEFPTTFPLRYATNRPTSTRAVERCPAETARPSRARWAILGSKDLNVSSRKACPVGVERLQQSDIAVGHAPSRAHSGHRRSSDTGVKVDKISPTAAVARGSVPATAMSSTHPKRPKRNLASHSLYQGVKFTLGGTGGEGVPGVDGGGDPCRGRSLGGISSVALVVINTVPGGDKTGGGDGIVSTEPPMRPLATTAVRIIGESTGDPDEDDLRGGGCSQDSAVREEA
ncbi:hypothetical protein J6590_092909 [Homalodisca vitripennis]|nr:hypothetical protein J6590_092909 [Homalodisca vitripennis]